VVTVSEVEVNGLFDLRYRPKKVIRSKSYFSKIAKIHKDLFKAHTSFGYATVCALVIGIGGIASVLTDIGWVIGDMSVEARPYHYFVVSGLGTSALIMIGSFIWLYRAITSYLIKKRNKQRRAAKHRLHETHTPTHCGVGKPKPRKPYQYFEVED
jgi:hypothetical protein